VTYKTRKVDHAFSVTAGGQLFTAGNRHVRDVT
jgi:hypothetical protein